MYYILYEGLKKKFEPVYCTLYSVQCKMYTVHCTHVCILN